MKSIQLLWRRWANPYLPGKQYLDWKLADPAGGDLEAIRPIRDEIEALVRALIQEIAPA
jgi:arsenate reductase